MKYVLLLDSKEVPLVCELQHHLNCHQDSVFEVIQLIESDDYESAIEKSESILDSLEKPRQIDMFPLI